MRFHQRVSSTGTAFGYSWIIATTLLLLCCHNVPADIVQYTFTGQIPVGAVDAHSEIDIGEFWEANFFVDLNTPDNNSLNTEQDIYLRAVVSGSLSFSGGYTSPFDFSEFDIWAPTNGFLGNQPEANAIQILDPAAGDSNDFHKLVGSPFSSCHTC